MSLYVKSLILLAVSTTAHAIPSMNGGGIYRGQDPDHNPCYITFMAFEEKVYIGTGDLFMGYTAHKADQKIHETYIVYQPNFPNKIMLYVNVNENKMVAGSFPNGVYRSCTVHHSINGFPTQN